MEYEKSRRRQSAKRKLGERKKSKELPTVLCEAVMSTAIFSRRTLCSSGQISGTTLHFVGRKEKVSSQLVVGDL